MNYDRYTKLDELQKKIEATKYERGSTLTAKAMTMALTLFKKNQRKDKEATRVSFMIAIFTHFALDCN